MTLRATASAVAFGLALATTGALASPNLVVNGSFETADFTGWTQFGATDFTGVTDVTGFGVTPTDGTFEAFFGSVGNTGGITQAIATIPGQSYLVSFDLLDFGGTPNSFAADFGSTLMSLVDDPGFPYAHFQFWVTATGASTPLNLTFQQDPTYYLLDSVSVTETPEPGAIALIGIALLSLLGFGLMRRRAGA